ncbi:MAG: LamG domain-containing protein [Flavobacteriaceae bacterium]
MSKWDGAESDYYGYYLGLSPTGILQWFVSNAAVETETPLPTGEWVHIVATYDYNQKFSRIYINGVLQEEITTGATDIDKGLDADYNARFSIGGAVYGEGGGQFDGEIDDVYIYDRAISASEVLELFNK